MTDQNNRAVLPIFLKQRAQANVVALIQCCIGFIEQNDGRLIDQRPDNGNLLLQPGRHGAGMGIIQIGFIAIG